MLELQFTILLDAKLCCSIQGRLFEWQECLTYVRLIEELIFYNVVHFGESHSETITPLSLN